MVVTVAYSVTLAVTVDNAFTITIAVAVNVDVTVVAAVAVVVNVAATVATVSAFVVVTVAAEETDSIQHRVHIGAFVRVELAILSFMKPPQSCLRIE